MIKVLLLLLLYFAASFAAFGAGCDADTKDRIGLYLWHLTSVLFLLALAFA